VTSKLKNLGSSSLVVLAIAGVTAPAFAGGTLAGSTITNTATVNYNVGTVARSSNDSDSFVVDRRIDLVVDETNGAATTVAPGQTGAVTTFTLQNTSNAILDFALAASQQVGGAATFTGTDNFNVTNVLLFRDTNNNGTYEAGTDLAVPQSGGVYYIDELGIDATVRLFVVADVPTGQVFDDVATVRLTATTREGGTAGTMGAVVTASASNTAAMDTVFADAAGITDAARDGVHSDRDDYRVAAANLLVNKSSTIVSDPIPGTPDFHIPGALIRYCIVVRNNGTSAATSVNLTDTLPTTLNIVASSLRVNATVNNNGTPGDITDDTCGTDGVVGGTATDNPSPTADTVAWSIGSIAPNTSVGLVVEATVN
jgi:uncharacterized repeat protein (TIGR01451 family)